jgi:hypothetical protein
MCCSMKFIVAGGDFRARMHRWHPAAVEDNTLHDPRCLNGVRVPGKAGSPYPRSGLTSLVLSKDISNFFSLRCCMGVLNFGHDELIQQHVRYFLWTAAKSCVQLDLRCSCGDGKNEWSCKVMCQNCCNNIL